MLYRKERLRRLRAQWACQRAVETSGKRGLSRILGRKIQRLHRQVKGQKQKRTRHILRNLRQREQEEKTCKQEWRLATWNTRGLGAIAGNIDQTLKIQNIIARMHHQRWGILVLTELLYREDRVLVYSHLGRNWYLVVCTRVGFLLSEPWWNRWQAGGAGVHKQPPRVAALGFPRDGWRRGLYVVGAYAPTSSSGKEARQALRHSIEVLMSMAPATSLCIVLGDLNAEMGNNRDQSIVGWEAMGAFATNKVSFTGQEWREWCLRHSMKDAASRFQFPRRVSWTHPRYLTEHELDHVLVRAKDVWHLRKCRILVEGPSVPFPWSPYTDHNPVEAVIRVGKQWQPRGSPTHTEVRPDVAKMRGAGHSALDLRSQWVTKVEQRLQALDTQPNWDLICDICRRTAVEVCGILHYHKGAPWLRTHGDEIGSMDQTIAAAQAADRTARRHGDHQEMARCRHQLQLVRKQKLWKIKAWEVEWLQQKADEANRVLGTPDATHVFRIVKDLIAAVGKPVGDGGRKMAASQEEVEAWKDHFAAIQAGIGEVNPNIWPDITSRPECHELDSKPTWEEYIKAVQDMKLSKAGGEDMMLAEYLKFGGPMLTQEVFRVVTDCWTAAVEASDGQEPESWPQSWKVGITVPLWKRKGNRADRNTWRGITLLSVGSKVVARICAARLQRWCVKWLNSYQFGFRAGSGVDDIHQVTRRLLEESAQSVHPHTILFRFFDLEKAYPKVPRHALWKILTLKGCPASFVKVLRTIHDGTHSKVRFQGFVSSVFVPERGLREGCPSSPILFNIFHDSLMEVFRARRHRIATQCEQEPGIPWTYKVDGKVSKRKTDREEEGRNIKKTRIEDFAYADDTALIGVADEARQAEGIFVQTVTDFAGKVNAHKTEGLRVCTEGRSSFDVPFQGESSTVKHVGVMLSERAGHQADTARAARQGVQRIEQISAAWTKGAQIARRKKDLRRSVRIRVLKAVVKGVLFTFVRTRAWQTSQIHRLQAVIHLAIRRAFYIRTYHLRRHGLTNAILCRMVQWESFLTAARRASLLWLGHIARMPTHAPQKQALFGWVENADAKQRCPFKQAQWLNACLHHAGISEVDWFRLAQDRSQWRKLVLAAYPTETVQPHRERELDAWKLGDPIPAWAQAPPQEQEREYANSDDELGERRRGGDLNADPRTYGRRPRQIRRRPRGGATPTCPVCGANFNKYNQLAFHYEAEHAVCSPDLTTVQSFSCTKCMQTFRRAGQYKQHDCPAKKRLPRLDCIDDMAQVQGADRTFQDPVPSSFHLFTDGSGGQAREREDIVAGWGVGVFDHAHPTEESPWCAALYGPVNITRYDPIWLGARVHTNNTGEVSAIGEACRYLLRVHAGLPPDHPRVATIYYDSTYAYRAVTYLSKARENVELIDTVAALVTAVRRLFTLSFQHVRAHTGIYGNEVADRLADRGAHGRVSPHATTWTERPPGPLGDPPEPPPPARPRRVYRRPAAANQPPREGRHPMITCDKCNQSFRSCDHPQHYPDCRGPDPANRTCKYCHKVFEGPRALMSRKNHERYSHTNEALRDGVITKMPKKHTRGG